MPTNDFDEMVRRAVVATLPAVAEAMRPIVREEVTRALPSQDLDRLIDCDEAAPLLGVTEGALRAAFQRGRLPRGLRGLKLGRRVRFRLRDVLAVSQEAQR